jgi:3-phenylpropionate/cinnamic acid dioxygenase small subunit
MMDAADFPSSARRASPDVHYEISQFLFDEAALLDERRFDEWLELIADDIRYWMPTRVNRLYRQRELEIAQPGETAFFDDDKARLRLRVERLKTARAWAEEPPSRARRLISNIRAWHANSPDEVQVSASFILYRSRREKDEDLFVGVRRDILRRTAKPAGWEIARRTIILDQTVLSALNLSVIF